MSPDDRSGFRRETCGRPVRPPSRRRAVSTLLLAIAGTVGCGSDTSSLTAGALPDGQAPSEMGRLRVQGNRIVNPQGQPVMLRGLGFADLLTLNQSGHFDEDTFEKASAWGANVVRLPVNPATYRLGTDRVFAYLDKAIAWARRYGMYLIIDWHVSGNLPQGLFLFGDSDITLDEIRQFWTDIAGRYANEPVVAFYELYNEPAAIEWEGGSWSFADWRATADDLVTLVRGLSPDTIPILAGMDFSYDYSAGGARPFASPDIALAVHPYPGRARPPRQPAWDKAFGYLADAYPMLMTEVGFDPCDQILPDTYRADVDYGREILTYAEEKGIGWTAFVFYVGPYWPMPLFADWQSYTPTTSGKLFRDVLLGTPIDEAGESSTGCPDG
jgi:endoglucanase